MKHRENQRCFLNLSKKIIKNSNLEVQKKLEEKIVMVAMMEVYCSSEHQYEDKAKISESSFSDELKRKISKYNSLLNGQICENCLETLRLSFLHTDKCPHTLYKTFCHYCPTSCYNSEEKKRIQPVMKFSGKRLLFKHPRVSWLFMKNLLAAKKLQNQYMK